MRKIAEILHMTTAILFTVVILLLNSGFGGEFLLLYENRIFIFIFCGCLVFFAIIFWIGSLLKSTHLLISFRTKVTQSKIYQFFQSRGWVVGWTLWNLLLVVVLGISLVYLIILVIDSVDIFTIVIITIPFVGFILLFIGQAFAIFKKQKTSDRPRVTSLIVSGMLFLLLILTMGIQIGTFQPIWVSGLEHQALFEAGSGNQGYRIPGLLVLPDDTILAFAEKRQDVMLDWGNIDLVMRRSLDGGITWGSEQTLMDVGDHTAGNACPLFDNDTQTIWLPFMVDNKYLFVMNSTDQGESWSVPRNITADVGLNLEQTTSQTKMLYGTGPGAGLQLSTGRLVVPSYYFDERGAHVLYSDDDGSSWHLGALLNVGAEAQAFESSNGSLCMNIRSTTGYRLIAWSSDGGTTWDTWYYDHNLTDVGCFGSICSLDSNRLLFSHPTQNSRGHLTVHMSTNEGKSWTISKEIYSGPAAYSHLAHLSDGTICMLFEQGHFDYRESIQFCRFTASWLI